MGMKHGPSLAEEYRLIVFDNRVQRRLFGLKRCEITGSGKDGALETFMNCTVHGVLLT